MSERRRKPPLMLDTEAESEPPGSPEAERDRDAEWRLYDVRWRGDETVELNIPDDPEGRHLSQPGEARLVAMTAETARVLTDPARGGRAEFLVGGRPRKGVNNAERRRLARAERLTRERRERQERADAEMAPFGVDTEAGAALRVADVQALTRPEVVEALRKLARAYMRSADVRALLAEAEGLAVWRRGLEERGWRFDEGELKAASEGGRPAQLEAELIRARYRAGVVAEGWHGNSRQFYARIRSALRLAGRDADDAEIREAIRHELRRSPR